MRAARRCLCGCTPLPPSVADRVKAEVEAERRRIAEAVKQAPGMRRWVDDSRVIDEDVVLRIVAGGSS